MSRKSVSISLLVLVAMLLVAPGLVYAQDITLDPLDPDAVDPERFTKKIWGFVWYDEDEDGKLDLFKEWGMTGETVELYHDTECDPEAYVGSTETFFGLYGFSCSNLTSGEPTPGFGPPPEPEFCLEFSPPDCYWVASPKDAVGGILGDLSDSDVEAGHRSTYRIEDVVCGYITMPQSMGGVCRGFVGDQVWCDANKNFLFDAGEEIVGATVSLYSAPDCDWDLSDGELLATTTTDANGEYEFGPLDCGVMDPVCYLVIVDTATLGNCTEGMDTSLVMLTAMESEQMDHDFFFRLGPEVVIVEEGVPEPATMLLLGSGLLGLAGYASLRLRKK